MLQDKIKEYFERKNIQIMHSNIVAHDIAEITEKECDVLYKLCGNLNHKLEQLEKENTNLKDEIKHWQDSWDILTKENTELKKENDSLKEQLAKGFLE